MDSSSTWEAKYSQISIPQSGGNIQIDFWGESFSPDAAYYVGPNPGMRFFEGAPALAVEARSIEDYGPLAEQEMADKRAEYFAAGKSVVWDMDLLSDEVVRKYNSDRPTEPIAFHRGEMTDAEPAVLGWQMPVDDLFEPSDSPTD